MKVTTINTEYATFHFNFFQTLEVFVLSTSPTGRGGFSLAPTSSAAGPTP